MATNSMATAQPTKVTNLTTAPDTYVEGLHTVRDGYLLYQPDQNAFIALYPQEFFDIRKEGEDNNNAISELQLANQDVTDKSLVLANLRRHPSPRVDELRKAEAELDQALNTLAIKSDAAKSRIEKITDLKTDDKKLVEVLPLTMKRASGQKVFYVPASKLKSAAADKRVFLVEGSAERSKGTKDKLFSGAALNTKEIHRRILGEVADKAKFEKKWKLKPEDSDEYAGQFFAEWSKTMGADAQAFLERGQKAMVEGMMGKGSTDPNDSHRQIDLKSEAQLMRWAGGAGLEVNFKPMQGNFLDKTDKDFASRFKRAAKAAQFNIKANAEVSFALGEAKVQTIAYYPHFAGWHAHVTGAGISVNMGHFRLRGDMTLSAVAGASLALEAGAALMLTASKQGLRGVPRDAKAAKAKVGAEGKVELFAGIKEGVDLTGAIQWLNPEGFIDDKSPKRKDPHTTWGEYVDVASVTTGVGLIQGLAASAGFEVSYRNGKFVIAAQASSCLGLGGAGNVGGSVGTAEIGQMFMCVAHQLKQADYSKLGALMEAPVFQAYNQALYMVAAGAKELKDFANGTLASVQAIGNIYGRAIAEAHAKGERFIRELEQRMRGKWGWFAYMPPEARGAMIASINDVLAQPQYAGDTELRQMAAFCVNECLATAQSDGHLENTLDRITVAIGTDPGSNLGVNLVNAILRGSRFEGGIERAELQVARATPLYQRPFLRNDEPDFIVAQLPLPHPSAMA